MRIDRLFTLLINNVHKIMNTDCIPVLMYHSVIKKVNRVDRPYYCTEISQTMFERQMEYLFENGYRIYSLKEVPKVFKEKKSTCIKKAVITFDDGYGNFYDYALPILSKYYVPTTVFIPSGIVKKSPHLFEGKELMTWDQIKECVQNPIIDIGSHSLSHGKLVDCSYECLNVELLQSKKIIENTIQKEVTTFSYPYRFPDDNKKFISSFCILLNNNGYKTAVTTRIGCVKKNDNVLLMKRIPVNEYDDIKLFEAKLQGSYDWLYIFQHTAKMLRRKH
jgi:peptidoglycan/xylan/chitin deacetylase (PgdA/CDA1 family)